MKLDHLLNEMPLIPKMRLSAKDRKDSKWSYTYDAFNRKMSRSYNGETIFYLYDGHEEIGSYTPKRKTIDLKILSASEGSLPIALEIGSAEYAPLISSQGHIIGLTEIHSGKLRDLSFLTLFGKDLSEKPLSPWRFCGKRHESELGLVDFGHRHFHPQTAQWLTQDPLGESQGPNLYSYVKNNPACYIDRFGLFGENFSFSSAWDTVKETVSACWDSVCNGFDYAMEGGCSAGNFAADYTYRNDRFMGGVQAAGGLIECGAGVTACVASRGQSPQGWMLMAHGWDTYKTGFDQAWTNKQQKSSTLELMEATGIPPETAVILEACASMSVGKLAKNSASTCASLSKVNPSMRVIQSSFRPVIVEGNSKYGLKHILKKHVHESTKKASKFSEGMGKEEIIDLVNEACEKTTQWNVANNGFLETTVDLGRIIGTDYKDGGKLTSKIRVIINEGILHSTYPCSK